MKKHAEKVSQKPPQSRRVGSAKGIKSPSDDLKEFIGLANLDLNDELRTQGEPNFFGSVADLVASILKVKPDAVRLHLLEILSDPLLHKYPPEYFVRQGFSAEGAIEHAQNLAVSIRYQLIRSARRILGAIVNHEPFIPAGVSLEPQPPNEKGEIFADYVVGKYTQALIGVDLRYIRQCELETCRKFYYARRINSVGCDPYTCGRILQKRSERARKKEKAKRRERKTRS